MSCREAKEKATDKFIRPGATCASITPSRNSGQQSTGTNKITQQQVSFCKSTLNNFVNISKLASTSSSTNISSDLPTGHLSGDQTQTEMNNVAITLDNANKLANCTNTIDISGN